MKDDLESRLLERAYTLEAMGRENKAIDTEHSLATITLTRDMLREAADALEAKDAEIAILKEGLRTALNLADMYVNERDTGSIYRNGMARARKALQDTDNG